MSPTEMDTTPSTTPPPRTAVQDLIHRIRDEGVQTGREEAERLVKSARTEADKLVADARREADEIRRAAMREIETHRTASLEALKQSARDTVLELQERVAASFESFVRRLVTDATTDADLVRALILELAGRAREQVIGSREIRLQLSEVFFENLTGGEAERRLIASLASDMLREGVEILPDASLTGGARVRLRDEHVEIDLSDEVISRLISNRLLPRFRAILEGME